MRGYAEEQAAQAGEQDRRLAELARLLVSGIDDDALRELANLALWPVPEYLVIVLLPPGAGAERANSHASSAVRRLPRCSRPVGDGA